MAGIGGTSPQFGPSCSSESTYSQQSLATVPNTTSPTASASLEEFVRQFLADVLNIEVLSGYALLRHGMSLKLAEYVNTCKDIDRQAYIRDARLTNKATYVNEAK